MAITTHIYATVETVYLYRCLICLRSYLETVDGADRTEVLEDLALLAAEGFTSEGEIPLDDRLSTAKQLVVDLEELFEQNRERFVTATSEREFGLVRRHLWTLARAREYELADRVESSIARFPNGY